MSLSICVRIVSGFFCSLRSGTRKFQKNEYIICVVLNILKEIASRGGTRLAISFRRATEYVNVGGAR
jgi:hypothetical protein